jgi:hypothetical protein
VSGSALAPEQEPARTRRVLLASTATRWLGTARMPRSFARAGFEVGLLTPPDSLAERSRYVSRIAYLPATAIPLEWLAALIRMVDAFAPQFLVPCDEMAVRLLFSLALETPPGLSVATHAQLRALIEDSLGDPRFYAASIDKTMLPAAAEALGIRVPASAVVSHADEALAQANVFGYPVLLKRRFGFAGEGVAVVDSACDVRAAAERLFRPDPLDLGARTPQLLVQQFVRGPYHSQALVARRGVTLASFAWERAVATTPIKGQTALLRFIDSPATRASAQALCRAFGMSGFFNVQFVIDSERGDAHLLEINRRIVTHMHVGERVGVDLARAFQRALDEGTVAALAPDPGTAGTTLVVFPREWVRDPRSRLLIEHPVDVPWDDPGVIRAMIAMRDEP